MVETMLPRRRSALALIVTDIAGLLAAQPPQVLMSAASIAIVAGEAGHMVDAPFNVALAIGAEWAYLRGIASSPNGSKGWTRALNYGALGLVIAYGMLWGVRRFGADPAATLGALLLTALHILPVAFVSFAAAMVHRSAVEAEAAERAAHEAEQRQRVAQVEAEERQRREHDERRREEIATQARAAAEERERERLSWELQQQAQDRELQRKIEAARVKVELSSRVKSEAVKSVDNGAETALQSVAPRLPKDVRLDALLTLIGQAGSVDSLDITATAQRFGVSRQTVYNDLEALRSTGRLPVAAAD